MPFLTVRRGPQPGAVYELNKDVVSIGRGAKNDIVIDDNDVSRNHCKLERQGDSFVVIDLQSTNGTFINGQRVNQSRLLQSGNLIELGDMITLEYEHNDEPVTQDADSALSHAGIVTPLTTSTEQHYAVVVEIGDGPRRIYALDNSLVTLGRDLSNDIVVQDPEISRWHLQLLQHVDGFTAKDLNSTNGTVLNGVRVTEPRPLQVYDTLELGTTVRLYYIYDTEEARQRLLGDSDVEMSLRDSTDVSKRDTKELELRFSRRKRTTRLGTGVDRGELVDHIFVAYAREDWETSVVPLMVALQDAGMQLWVDQYLAQGSQDWEIAMEQALHECWLMVLVASPAALESRNVRLAYRYFINREKPVLPLVYASADLPPELATLDALPLQPDTAARTYQRLIHKIIDMRS